jgi:hypothetical protein
MPPSPALLQSLGQIKPALGHPQEPALFDRARGMFLYFQ